MAYPQESSSDRVDFLGIELVEIASVIDEDCTLEGFFGERVIADTVVGEVVEDFQGQEVAGCRDVGVPGEYGAVDYLHVICVSARRGGLCELRGLEGGEGRGNFDDFEFGPGVDVWLAIANVIQHVEHQSAVPSTQLVDNEIMYRVIRKSVICDQVPRDSFPVVWTEQLGRSMPQLPTLIWDFRIQCVLEIRVPLPQLLVELWLIGHAIEIERLTGTEDDYLFREVSIMRIVQTI